MLDSYCFTFFHFKFENNSTDFPTLKRTGITSLFEVEPVTCFCSSNHKCCRKPFFKLMKICYIEKRMDKDLALGNYKVANVLCLLVCLLSIMGKILFKILKNGKGGEIDFYGS